jgi:hypothetical protein
MAHEKVTVSLVVLVAVMMLVLNPPAVLVVWVTPPENVAVYVSGYFRITIPDPP